MPSRCGLGVVACGLALSLLLFAASCEFPFSLRDSEPPSDSASRIKIQLTTDPGFVRTNVWRCYINKAPSPYSDQISDDFVFVTDPTDAAALAQTYPGDFSEWDANMDKRLTAYLLDDGRCYRVRCLPDTLCIPDSTVLENTETLSTIQYSYEFAFQFYDSTRYVSGEARLHMRKEAGDNLWRIYKWEDIKPQSQQADTTTWGMLKGETLATIR